MTPPITTVECPDCHCQISGHDTENAKAMMEKHAEIHVEGHREKSILACLGKDMEALEKLLSTSPPEEARAVIEERLADLKTLLS